MSRPCNSSSIQSCFLQARNEHFGHHHLRPHLRLRPGQRWREGETACGGVQSGGRGDHDDDRGCDVVDTRWSGQLDHGQGAHFGRCWSHELPARPFCSDSAGRRVELSAASPATDLSADSAGESVPVLCGHDGGHYHGLFNCLHVSIIFCLKVCSYDSLLKLSPRTDELTMLLRPSDWSSWWLSSHHDGVAER